MMDLIQFIRSKVKLTEEANMEIDNSFNTEVYAKGALIIRPDSFPQKVYFVENGLLRTYYYKLDKDITEFFFPEGTFTASLNSIFYDKSEPYGWEALEKSTVRSIPYRDLTVLMEKYPVFQQFFFRIAIDMLNLFGLKLESLQFRTAEERYRTMVEMYPDILRRVSLGHIASYLGVTQQTLSVIRAKK